MEGNREKVTELLDKGANPNECKMEFKPDKSPASYFSREVEITINPINIVLHGLPEKINPKIDNIKLLDELFDYMSKRVTLYGDAEFNVDRDRIFNELITLKKIARILISSRKFDLDHDYRPTLLIQAIHMTDPYLVKLLVNHGADMNEPNSISPHLSPLGEAKDMQNRVKDYPQENKNITEIIDFLIAQGAK